MWANAQRDHCPAEYRWRPLFNAAKFGWFPLLKYCAVTLPRRETRWNLLECPKLLNRSHTLVGQSSPYADNMWGRYCCLTSFFSDCWCMPSLWRHSPTKLCDGAQMVHFWRFLGPAFPVRCVQHTSDLHSKSALGPHHVKKYGRHPICDSWA